MTDRKDLERVLAQGGIVGRQASQVIADTEARIAAASAEAAPMPADPAAEIVAGRRVYSIDVDTTGTWLRLHGDTPPTLIYRSDGFKVEAGTGGNFGRAALDKVTVRGKSLTLQTAEGEVTVRWKGALLRVETIPADVEMGPAR